ncbi:MAG: TIM barrel protein [Planctomycetes bacterium]|nr:TIM barrel protein [Planctomycetota bacterium]
MNIGLAGWAINRCFKAKENPLKLVDLPKVAKEEFGLDRVELNSPFLESHDDDYLAAIKNAAEDAGVIMEGMAVDGTGDMSSPDEEKRAQAVANALAYFDVAEKLGLEYFRINTSGSPDGPPEMMDACIDSFRQLCAEGEKRGIKIATENHGGLSTNPTMMVKLILGVDSPAMATLPDFGNFPEEIILSGIAQIMPWAVGVHVKWTRRDRETREVLPGKRDIPALVKVAKQAGFDGTLFIEDGGPDPEQPHNGVLELKGALMACFNSSLV